MHDRRILTPDRPLRVLQLDPNANTPPYDRALSRALAAAGCEVELVTSRFVYEHLGSQPDVRVSERFFRLAGSALAERIGLGRRPSVRRALKAAEYPLDWLSVLARLARSRPDIVHVQWSVQPRLDLLFWRTLRRLGIPLVYTAHNLVPHHARPADRARYLALYRAADAIVVHSQRSARALHHEWGIPDDRVAVVPHGPLLEAQPPLARAVARDQLDLPAAAEIVLFAGLIEPYKGLADLIAAFGAVAARRPHARLVVAGKPNEPFAPYDRQLTAAGLRERTTLDLAFLPESRLAAHLCAADLIVLPYLATTSSGLLFAARRFGCPVIATATGDLGEIVVDGQSGLLVPPAAPVQLGEAIQRLLADPALAGRLGAAGQAAAFGPESWGVAAGRTVALYERLLTSTSFRRGAPIR
jgi:glycosyltransferase involved in cell wall biosynthesis